MQKLHFRLHYSVILLITIFNFSATHAQTPLAKALSAKDTVTALALINAGEDPNQMNGKMSLLSGYCRYSVGDSMAYFLLRHGANPDSLRSAAGRTVLHVAAAYYACEELCGALLEAGANINARTKDGTTPLMLAAQSAKPGLVKFLIQKGADWKLKDNSGKTAYDYALSADSMFDEHINKSEESCEFSKPQTIAYLKNIMQ